MTNTEENSTIETKETSEKEVSQESNDETTVDESTPEVKTIADNEGWFKRTVKFIEDAVERGVDLVFGVIWLCMTGITTIACEIVSYILTIPTRFISLFWKKKPAVA